MGFSVLIIFNQNTENSSFSTSGYIAEKDAQDVKIASRALIDEQVDRSFTIKCDTINCVVICSGLVLMSTFQLQRSNLKPQSIQCMLFTYPDVPDFFCIEIKSYFSILQKAPSFQKVYKASVRVFFSQTEQLVNNLRLIVRKVGTKFRSKS